MSSTLFVSRLWLGYLRRCAPAGAGGRGGGGEGVSIRFGGVVDNPLAETLEKGWGYFSPAPGEDCLFGRGVGSFLVRGGCDVVVDPFPGLGDEGCSASSSWVRSWLCCCVSGN